MTRRIAFRMPVFLPIASALLLAASISPAWAAPTKTAPKAKSPAVSARIGVISILSGPGAAYGEAITNGFKLARDEINARGDVAIELVIPASVRKAVAKHKIRKVALLYGNDDVFTKSGFNTMKQVAGELGLAVVTVEAFQKGQADYKAQLTKIKSLAPNAVFCSALYEEGAVILSQARKMGIDVPFVGGNSFNSPKVIEIAGPAAEGLIVATPWFADRPDPKVKAFVRRYEKSFGKKPDQFAAQAYDALYIMAEALRKAGKADREALRDALAGIRNFDGVLGRFSFSADRDVVMEPTVLVVKGGRFRLFE